jgi:uncharacterized membrane protein YfcA
VPIEELAVMALALGGGGLMKGATGMGLPVVALPILAAFLDIPSGVAIICVTGLVLNTIQVWNLRADLWTADFLPRLLIGGAIGTAVGTWVLTSLPEQALSLVLAVLLFCYLALRFRNPHLTLSKAAGRRYAAAAGLGAGIMQGATGISSPIGVTFIHAMRLHRTAHVFAVSAMFLMFGIVQLPALAIAGVMTWPLFFQGVLALAPALAMMPVGAWLAGKLSPAAFDRAILALLVVVGVKLLADGLGLAG